MKKAQPPQVTATRLYAIAVSCFAVNEPGIYYILDSDANFLGTDYTCSTD